MTPRLTTAQARALDRLAIEEFGIPSLVLMENAARNLAELLVSLGASGPMLLLCGPGNNGGDGLAMARHLDRLGMTCRILLFGRLEQLSPQTATHWNVARRCGFPCRLLAPEEFDPADLTEASWVVDALFGSGLTGPLRPPFARMVACVNEANKPVFAVDVPSGFDADLGLPGGPCIRATHTGVTVAERVGFAHPEAALWLGQVHIVDIGLPRFLIPG